MSTFSTSLVSKSFFLSFCLFLPLFIQAKTYTVSNNPETPGQYSSVQAAIDAAAAGDTLLLQGSPVVYGNFSVTKTLTLIGPGHHPEKQNPLVAICNGIYIQANDCKFYSLVVTNLITASSARRNNITIAFCNIGAINTSDSGGNNWTIINNRIVNIDNESGAPILISNNIIVGSIRGCWQSTLIRNNLFIGTGRTSYGITNAPTGGIVANNIFYNKNLSIQGTYSNTQYQNNLTYIPNSSFTFPKENGNLSENNLENVNPLFVNVPADATTFSYTHNYRLQAASPARNKGNDGRDIGIYNLGAFSMTGELPHQPVIRTMTIQNPNVPSGGALRVSATISRAVLGN